MQWDKTINLYVVETNALTKYHLHRIHGSFHELLHFTHDFFWSVLSSVCISLENEESVSILAK